MHTRNAIGLCCLHADTQLCSIKSGGNTAIMNTIDSNISYLPISAKIFNGFIVRIVEWIRFVKNPLPQNYSLDDESVIAYNKQNNEMRVDTHEIVPCCPLL